MAEKEYIEREKLNDMLEDFCVNETFYDAMQTIPAADVAPVKHGHWIRPHDATAKSYRWICSVCGDSANYIHTCGKRVAKVLTCGLTYCPNCGAKMDG